MPRFAVPSSMPSTPTARLDSRRPLHDRTIEQPLRRPLLFDGWSLRRRRIRRCPLARIDVAGILALVGDSVAVLIHARPAAEVADGHIEHKHRRARAALPESRHTVDEKTAGITSVWIVDACRIVTDAKIFLQHPHNKLTPQARLGMRIMGGIWGIPDAIRVALSFVLDLLGPFVEFAEHGWNVQ